MSTVDRATSRFAMTLCLLAYGFSQRPKDERALPELLGALGAELERLAGEAYRLADEATGGAPAVTAGAIEDDPIWRAK